MIDAVSSEAVRALLRLVSEADVAVVADEVRPLEAWIMISAEATQCAEDGLHYRPPSRSHASNATREKRSVPFRSIFREGICRSRARRRTAFGPHFKNAPHG